RSRFKRHLHLAKAPAVAHLSLDRRGPRVLDQSAYAHIMGRTAYESISGSMTTSTDHPFADILNAGRKVVFSRTLKTADWANTTIAAGDTAEEIDKLRLGGDGHIVVWGGVSLWRSLMRLDLVGEHLDGSPHGHRRQASKGFSGRRPGVIVSRAGRPGRCARWRPSARGCAAGHGSGLRRAFSRRVVRGQSGPCRCRRWTRRSGAAA